MMYAFCESEAASSYSRWHIRQVPDGEPLKLGGGITTASLCGYLQARRGWDLAVSIDGHHLSHSCTLCAEEYTKRTQTGGGR